MMIETLTWAIQILFWGILIIGIMQRSTGWVWKVYFPVNWSTCAWVYDNKSRWWGKAKDLLTYWPEKASVVGFLCLLIWPCLICLNLLLLAQVIDLFFQGGKRITLIWVGTYSIFPLIMGFLYATSQTLLGILHGHSKNIWSKIGFIIVLSLMILVEAGLAGYRAWLLSTNGIEISPTLVDTLMIRGGIILGAFIGLFVPLAEALAGRVSFLDFIEPVITAMIRWFGGLMLSFWGFIVWWVCGFYSEKPPPPPPPGEKPKLPGSLGDLNEAAGSLKGEFDRVGRDLAKLRETTQLDKRLDDIRQFKEHMKETEALTARITIGEWDGQLEKNKERISKTNNRDALHTIKEEIRATVRTLMALAHELMSNEEKIAGFSQIDKWKGNTNQFKSLFESGYQDVVKKLENIRSHSGAVTKRAEGILLLLLGKSDVRPDANIPPLVIAQIQDLLNQANVTAVNLAEQKRKEEAQVVLDWCHKLIDGILCTKYESEINALFLDLEKLKSKFDQHILEMDKLSAAPYASLEAVLIQAGKTLKMYRKAFRKQCFSCGMKRSILLISPGGLDEEGVDQ